MSDLTNLSTTTIHTLAIAVALVFSALLMPACRSLAMSLDIVDKPGGRKEHLKVTPLLGGLGVFVACLLAIVFMWAFLRDRAVVGFPDGAWTKKLTTVFLGSTILFITGLIDDVIKRKTEMPYYYKLLGQVAAISLAMLVMAKTHMDNVFIGEGDASDYAYLIFFLLWLLTTINSFNFSDNTNGLMSGLAVIAILTSLVYLDNLDNRIIILGLILVGSILGFLPFNFPRAKIFIGDAGSMFIGYWAGVFTWPLAKGFMGEQQALFGLDNLLPPFLLLGMPLYDAGFVLIQRLREGRPIYLGDNQHLSHRLLRAGYNVTETSLILWGAALILTGFGAMSITENILLKLLAFFLGMTFLIVLTVVIMKAEKKAMSAGE